MRRLLMLTFHIRSCRIPRCSLVQVDPNGDWGAGRGAEDDPIGSADEPVGVIESSAPDKSIVIVDDRSDTEMPTAADLDTHTRICHEVLHIAAAPAVFGHQPEHIAVEPVAHRGQARLAAAPSNGLKQRERARRNPKSQCGPEGRIKYGLLQPTLKPTSGGHEYQCATD